jgi:hypothetical protein
MRSDKSILVLDLKRRIKEAVHELKQLLVVIQEPTPIHVVQVEVEEAFIFAALK